MSNANPESVFNSLLVQGRVGEALDYASDLAARAPAPEKLGQVLLRLGILCERAEMFDAAVRVYETGLTTDPVDRETSYFLMNNLGYSLNQLGRFAQGEVCARAAIHTDPQRHNAWKNLGVALEGQKQYREAADAFITATCIRPQDPRALVHLAKMTEREHEERTKGTRN